MKDIRKYPLIISLAFLPLVVSAQSNIQEIIKVIFDIVQGLTALAMSAAVLVFFWGIVKFIASAGNGEEKEAAKKIMGWGIIALFIMISFYGVILILQETFFPGVNFTFPEINDVFGP